MQPPRDAQRHRQWLETYVKGDDVSRALEYFNDDGLSTREAASAYIMLEHLGGRTGNMWTPGGCRTIPILTGVANEVYRISDISQYFGPFVPKRYFHWHFFWVLQGNEGNRQLVVDPAGCPIDYPENKDIKPYFGLLDKAPETHRRFYEMMEDMDN